MLWWPLLTICSFLVLFVYPCAWWLKIALWFACKFSCMTIFYHMSINMILETVPIFFHQIYNLNIIQTEYWAILTIIHSSVSFVKKYNAKLDFELQFVLILVVIRYFRKKSIVNMNDLNHHSLNKCQSPSVFSQYSIETTIWCHNHIHMCICCSGATLQNSTRNKWWSLSYDHCTYIHDGKQEEWCQIVVGAKDQSFKLL